jgi:hypothetical protein
MFVAISGYYMLLNLIQIQLECTELYVIIVVYYFVTSWIASFLGNPIALFDDGSYAMPKPRWMSMRRCRRALKVGCVGV